MKIVVEYVFLQNFLLMFLILKTVSFMLHEKTKSVWLSATLSGVTTTLIPALHLSPIGNFLLEAGLGIVFICISFNLKKFILLFLGYYCTLFLFGGACYYIQFMFGHISTTAVLSIACAVFLTSKYFSKKIWKKRQIENFNIDVSIENADKKVDLRGYLDSGNLLVDPLTQSPVSLIDFRVFEKLFDNISLLEVFSKSKKLKNIKLAHFITLNSINFQNKIFVFVVDKIVLNKKIIQKPTVGLSLKDFKKSLNADMIINGAFAF